MCTVICIVIQPITSTTVFGEEGVDNENTAGFPNASELTATQRPERYSY